MDGLLGLEGQQALVVGGGLGSGRLTALRLARGASVAVVDIDPNVRGRSRGGRRARSRRRCDDEVGAAAAVDEAHDVLGGLTRVANIVGLVDMRPFVDTDAAHWDAQLRLNLYSQVLVCHAAGRRMVADRSDGAIAMVASVSSIYAARDQVAYGIAKAGVMSLARTLADEWGPHGIRVNCVAPDITAVPRLTDSVPGSEEDALAIFDAMAASEGVPLRRFGRTHEIAGPLLFLLSDMSSYMTGQTLVVDGGTMVHFPHRSGANTT